MTSTAMTAQSQQPLNATPADVNPVAETLAQAFLTDPVLSWCYPDRNRRAAILPQLFGVVADAYLPHGSIYTTSNHAAAAVWVPPGTEVDQERLMSQLGEMSGQDADRLYALFELLEAHHPHDRSPHQYLFLLGTRPAWQSQGLGSRLLRVVLDDCDRDGTPAYLEATSERNKRLYERHGFEVTEVVRPPDGPDIWCMWRNA
jgi:GNAT superfamily N-acetyltransferase